MQTRILTGITAALVMVALIYRGSAELITTVVLLCATLAYLEYDRLFFTPRSIARQLKNVGLIFLMILAIRHGENAGWVCLWCSFLALCFFACLRGHRSGDSQRVLEELCLEWLGFIYIVSLLGFVLPIVQTTRGSGRDLLSLLFLIVFGGDTAAYFFGNRFGKRRLSKNLSPKKSVEGSAAALVLSCGIAWGWAYFMQLGKGACLTVLLFAPCLSILAQSGDLFESMMKRSRSRKDSGNFLPGHGGILDRIDGLALSAPAFYLFVTYLWDSL